MNLEIIKDLPRKPFGIKEVLQDAIIPEMNIYNQAYLEIDRPLIKTSIVHPKTYYELGVQFKLTGQVQGDVYCYLDTFNKTISTKEINFFQLLFIESMNILLGRILTNMENNHQVISILSNPTFIGLKQQQHIEVNKGDPNQEVLAIGYKLIAALNEYDCRIIFDLNKKI